MQNQYNLLLKKLIKHSIWGVIIQCLVITSMFASEVNKETNTRESKALTTDMLRPEITVTGTVKSADDGSTLPGVNITIKGTTLGTTTDKDGKYAIRVPDGDAVLVFSFIGFLPQELVVGSQSVIDVALVTDVQQLAEVVVVGYGTQKKETLTGAVSAVDNQEIVTTKNENVQNMLTGKIPGLRVRQNSSEPGQFNNSIDIRGFGAPLVVVDGIPRDNMSRIDPEDIESISVVKDASAAVFGSRAANGVILITTKKGTKTGEPSITYSGNMAWQVPSNYPDLVDAADWMTLYNERDRHNVDNSNPTLRVVGYGESGDEIAKFAQSDLQLEACRLKLFYISCSFTLNM